MRNIFLFIRVYFTFIFFLFLMGLSLYLLFSYNRYHNAIYSSVAGEITGKINRQVNDVEYYFHLKQTNDSLVKANEALYNKLKENYEIADTANKIAIDTIQVDSLKKQKKYLYMQAKVVRNSVSQPNNYIILHRGSQQGIHADMGVIGINNAVIGTVMEVSDNYSVIMSLLHEQSNLSARLLKSGETGTIIWDGADPKTLILKDVSKTVKVTVGDSVVTSGFSDKFPPGLMVGIVSKIISDKTSSNYVVSIKAAANFETLQYAFIIDNLQKEEPQQLLKKVKSK